ncbi:MAG TPA: YcaO-like family protein, partial [Syntrophorhabdales bacterium]|nr:YcaO-like family protein [Syntrophorhabdales bacterium]
MDKGLIRQIRGAEIITEPLQIWGSAILLGGRDADGRFIPPRVCGGSGFTEEEARERACGEAVERYCAARYDEGALSLSSYLDLKGEAIPPDAFALYSREQYDLPGFEYRPFRRNTRINWVQGFSLTRRRPVFVPAAFVYLPYWPVGGETAIGLLPSTGLSCGKSLVEASLQGICEVIERDAIMIMWLHQMAKRLDPSSIGSRRLDEIIGSPRNGIIRIFDITTDVTVPTRFAVLTDFYRGRSLVSCGAATKWDPKAAAEKAVLEALVVRQAVQKIIRTCPPRKYGKDYRKVRQVDDHLNLYTDP